MKKTYYRAELIEGKPTITPVELSYRAASSRKRKKTVQIFEDEKGAALWLVDHTYRSYRAAQDIYNSTKESMSQTVAFFNPKGDVCFGAKFNDYHLGCEIIGEFPDVRAAIEYIKSKNISMASLSKTPPA